MEVLVVLGPRIEEKLLARIGAREVPLWRTGENRVAAEKGPGFVLVSGTEGRIEFLCAGSRCRARMK